MVSILENLLEWIGAGITGFVANDVRMWGDASEQGEAD